mmetsp:Transcript_20158/g.37491  ORF Transcript_20158/g.37491 Transcript_20158/m.37491 type:complete len:687 (+) Transcript_20158:5903-7963(+)
MASLFKKIISVKLEHSSGFNSEGETTIRSNTQKSPEIRKSNIVKTRSVTPQMSFIEDQPYKYKAVWRRALAKIKIRRAIGTLNNDILIYGTSNEIVDAGSYEEIMALKRRKAMSVLSIQQKLPWYLLSPSSFFCSTWGVIVCVMLAYTVTYMPYRIGFLDPVYFDAETVFDIIVDFVFIIDSILNCFITYKIEGEGFETSIRKVLYNYATNWLVFDVISCVPVSLIEVYEGEQASAKTTNSLVKIARLPRLYKILRVIRISKVTNLLKRHPIYEKLTDYIDLHVIVFKFLKFFLMCLLCIHNLACIWHMTAKFDNFSYETWVIRLGYADKSNLQRYLASFYWATTTLATVGYGDISARTDIEMIFSVVTMGFGVAFYSMIISSATNLISYIDIKEAKTAIKLSQADEFGEEVGLSKATIQKIRKIIKQNSEHLTFDQQELFRYMPKTLKYEVAISMYGGIANLMPLLNGKDTSFVVSLFSRLKPCNISEDEILYTVGSIAEEVFFVQRGRIELVIPQCDDIIYRSYLKGSYYGEIELFHNIVRIDTAKSTKGSRLLVLSAADFHTILKEFPQTVEQFETTALERLKRNTRDKLEAMEKLKNRTPELEIDREAHEKRISKFIKMLKRKPGYELRAMLVKDQALNAQAEQIKRDADELKLSVHTLLEKFKARLKSKPLLPPILKKSKL